MGLPGQCGCPSRRDTGLYAPQTPAIPLRPYTATHVLHQYHLEFEYTDPPWGNRSVSVRFSAQLGADDRSELFTSADGHDISLIRIRGRSIVQGSFPTIEIAPPKIGEIVTAYGFEKPRYGYGTSTVPLAAGKSLRYITAAGSGGCRLPPRTSIAAGLLFASDTA